MDNIKFWYPVKSNVQLDFEGHTHSRDVVAGEGHIVFSEILLCRQSRDRLQGEVGAKKQRTVQSRIEGVKLCPKCQQRFKEHPDLGWQKWTRSISREAV